MENSIIEKVRPVGDPDNMDAIHCPMGEVRRKLVAAK
jgi:hypothetical protein